MKDSKKPNPSMTSKHVLLFGVGALVGGGIGYAVGSRAAKKEQAQLGAGEPPPIPPKPSGPGFGSQGYREPESVNVQLPNTPGERDQLDATICSVFRAMTGTLTPDAVTQGTLQKLVPEVQWPIVEGDHWSMIALQAMVGMRVQQIAVDADPSKTAAQNLDAFCPKPAGLSPA